MDILKMRKDVCILSGSGIKEKNKKKLRVVFCGYRSWALETIEEVSHICNIEVVDIIEDEDSYREKVLHYIDGYVDCIILLGWSWIIKDDTLNRFVCVGIHPSDLPMYRGGSPIQHQIIDGLEKTKISLMSISTEGVDVGAIWGKEEWDLTGKTMDIVFRHLTDSSIRLLRYFFDNFDVLTPSPQKLDEGSYCKRRKPSDSKTTWETLANMELKSVYNLIRALTDPYPNLYVEDNMGNRLYFKEAEYVGNTMKEA